MNYYVKALKNYAVFKGKATRKEFWLFYLYNVVISALLYLVVAHDLAALYALSVTLPSLAVSVRRLHDINRNGWWVLLNLLPPIGWLILIVFFASESEPETTSTKDKPRTTVNAILVALSLVLSVWTFGVFFLFAGLSSESGYVQHPLINKPAPEFNLPTLYDPEQHANKSDLIGKPWLLVAWASWCKPCEDQNKVLLSVTQSKIIDIYGLDYKDNSSDAKNWLRQHGNPYASTWVDNVGVYLDFGIYGVPETYLIDEKGIIRYRFVGPITQSDIDDILIPKLRELEKGY